MALLPRIKRISKEDFPSQPWIDKLLGPLNAFMEALVTALNQGLTFRENFISVQKSIDYTDGTTSLPVQIAWPFKATKPTGLLVVGLRTVSGADPTDAVWAQWSYDGSGIINISQITGLTAASRYSIDVLAFVS